MKDGIFESTEDILNFDFYNNITQEILVKNFGQTYSPELKKVVEPPFTFAEHVLINKNNRVNKTDRIFSATIGSYIFNSTVLSDVYLQKFGFETETITNKIYNKIINNYTTMKIKGTITPNAYALFLDKIHWLGAQIVMFSGESFDSTSLTMSDEFVAEKDRQLSTLDDNSTPEEVNKVETDLLEKLKDETKNKPLGRIISAGAKGDYSNNYKNLVMMRGIVGNKLLKGNLTEGNNVSAYMELGNNAVKGSIGRSLKTQQGGYAVKLLAKAFSASGLKEEDCGTKEFLVVPVFKKSDINLYKYRLVGLKPNSFMLEELSDENADKFLGKTVYIRSPLFCKTVGGICEKCYGNLWKYNGVKSNLASIIMPVASQIMGKSMKSFHNLTAKYEVIDLSNTSIFSAN